VDSSTFGKNCQGGIEMAKDTHLVLTVTIDTFDVKVDYKGHNAWVDASRAAAEIGRSGFFHREDVQKMEAKFYPLHRINLVEIRHAG